MKARVLGAAIGFLVGYWIGKGSGIVGGAFGPVPGVIVFVPIGFGWGWSAGPDVSSQWRKWRGK